MYKPSKFNVLIVDDVEANLIALESLIENENIEIYSASSGNEALKLAWKYPFALALIDVQMPEMDGFELVQLLKSNKKTRDIICIFVTAISKEPKYAFKGYQVGAIDYLYKPLDPIITNAKVNTYLELFLQREQLITQNRKLEHYALRVENAADINAMIDPVTMEVVEVNSAIKSVMGYTPNKLVGSSMLDYLHPDELHDIKNLIHHFIKQGEPVINFESRFRNSRHDYIWLSVQMVNKHGYLFTNARDVSANRHYIQEIVRAKENAENERKAKEQFLANMSHEIRTPLNGIIGLTRLIRDSELNEDQTESVDLILHSSHSLLNIINDILDLSKIEAGKFTFDTTDFQLEKIVSGVIALLKNKADAKELTLSYHLDREIPEWIVGDPHRLNQILMNLIGNAIKFTSKGSVEVRMSVEKGRSRNYLLKAEVIDTGIGIPQGKIESIFESFSQASETTSHHYGGTGLGLTISKKLVELQGGRMWAESAEGKGSTFFFTLSVQESEKNSKNEQESVHNPFDLTGLEGKTVLLVDDNKVNRMVGARTLSRWKINVDLACDGTEAVEKAKYFAYDAILMDLQMPGIDGYHAATMIRSEATSPNAQIPIIALTANVMGSVVKNVKQAGMDFTLTKPFEPAQLFQTLYRLIYDGRESMDEAGRDQVDMIDLDYLLDISGGGKEFVHQFLQSFVEQAPGLLETACQAILRKDQITFNRSVSLIKQDFIYINYEAAKVLINNLETLDITHINKGEEMIASLREMVSSLIKKFEQLLAIDIGSGDLKVK